MVWNAHITWDRLYGEVPPSGRERFVTYLPLSHIAAQVNIDTSRYQQLTI